MKNIKNNTFFGIIIGALLMGIGLYVYASINANEITFTPSNENCNVGNGAMHSGYAIYYFE